MFLLQPTCKLLSPMPSGAPQEEAAEEEAAEEEAAEEEEGDHRPLQDHLKRHKDNMSPHRKEM